MFIRVHMETALRVRIHLGEPATGYSSRATARAKRRPSGRKPFAVTRRPSCAAHNVCVVDASIRSRGNVLHAHAFAGSKWHLALESNHE